MEIKIKSIPSADFHNYRIDCMFDGYKWDLQAGEQSTIGDKVVLMARKDMDFLENAAISLYHETLAMESALKCRPDLAVRMGISEEMADVLCNCSYEQGKHVRLMRFDFHFTTEGWRISEVNSDVPAGYPEASILPALAQKYFDEYAQYGDFGDVWASRIMRLAQPESTIAYLHDTHTVEDYQILHFLGDLMEKHGYDSTYADPDYIKWKDGRAVGFGAIMRYYPVEWLEYKKGVEWVGFCNSATPSCNHPIALLTQSKRLPLVWDELEVEIPFWKRLLPETVCPLTATDGFILKPAFGRVGEGINIPGTVSEAENLDIITAAHKDPSQWVAQRMFESVSIDGKHLSLGIFVIDGIFGGVFGRISERARIDSEASEVPVLVKSKG